MKIIEKKTHKIVFSAEINRSLSNAIRRYTLQIPVVAIDEVEIVKNDSPLYDETLAHRLGLVPLKAGKKVEGKMNLSSNKEGLVYSGELKGDAEVIYDKIPLTLLGKGQEVEFKVTLTTGTGSQHSKFSPGLMFYREINEIILDKDLLDGTIKNLPEIKITEKGSKAIILDDGEKEVTSLFEEMAEEKNKHIEINPTNKVLINLETFGQLSVEDIFKKSIDTLKKDLNEISKKISK